MAKEMDNAMQNEEVTPVFVDDEKLANNIEDSNDSNQDSNGFKLYQMKLKDLALLAKPYSNKSLETLEKLGKKRLIAIIKAKSDDEGAKNATAISNNLESVIKSILYSCDEFKKQRTGEPNNHALKETIQNNINPAFGNGVLASVDNTWLARSIVVVGLLYIAIDSFFGWSGFFNYFKNLKKKKATSNEH